jgi:hypothetical protein
MNLDIKLVGIERTVNNLRATKRGIKLMDTQDIADRITDKARMNIINAVSGKWKSYGSPGLRKTGISSVRIGNKQWIVRAFSVDQRSGFPYAGVVEYGRSAIKQKKGQKSMPLEFSGGRIRYAREVGGFGGYHFMGNAAAWAKANVGKMMRAKVKEVVSTKGRVYSYKINFGG